MSVFNYCLFDQCLLKINEQFDNVLLIIINFIQNLKFLIMCLSVLIK